MRARALAGSVVASAAIVSLGWQIGAAHVAAESAATGSAVTGSGAATGSGTSTGSTGTTTTPSSSASPSASATPSSSASSSAGTAKSSVSGTFDGTTAETQYGPVQVSIVVASGKITDVKALQLTDQGGRSVEISNDAAPVLRTEALSAQSAKIQSVSGATFTSEGYITSLQSAIDKAGL
ncbi:FMN-binding protein [Frondihabitans sp. PAMC 28766]|uniref:FMN-binding protein n=1 Tax=Frondihabitans sp. PAMC 28766 TaxID=1795630 RepID=UPI00078E655E|nr:FMN-binding protein [Frondihabitans sp. PAMC 28766]AMM20774.1 FMN-binding protein [Frondihabitans sp. PAMC 28766]